MTGLSPMDPVLPSGKGQVMSPRKGLVLRELSFLWTHPAPAPNTVQDPGAFWELKSPPLAILSKDPKDASMAPGP